MMRYTSNATEKAPATDAAPVEPTIPETPIAEPAPPEVSPLSDDILHGADAIARFVFGDPKHRRKVYYLTGDAKRGIPYFKIGSLTCARKSTLLRWIEEQEKRR